MRNERYLPALTTPVIRYVPEPLTGDNIDTSWMLFKMFFKRWENTAVGPWASGLADDIFCVPMPTLTRCCLKGGECKTERKGPSLNKGDVDQLYL